MKNILDEGIGRINKCKAVFDSIYNDNDPRSYFSVLGALDYMIPDVAEPIIRQILAAKSAMHGVDATVLDVGCSYGINAATHRFPLNFASLRRRYAQRAMLEIPSEEMIRLDRNFYASWPEIGSTRFIGLDASHEAIRYANETGLHIGGVVANLEAEQLAAADAKVIAPADVLLSTGAIGYVTERTYRQLLGAITDGAWVISFVLRMFPYSSFENAFAERGMVTERLTSGTFVQRRFEDAAEFEQSLLALEAQGIDPEGLEAEGLFHAELFVSRPAADAAAVPLNDIVSISSGRFSSLGARYVHVDKGDEIRVAMEA